MCIQCDELMDTTLFADHGDWHAALGRAQVAVDRGELDVVEAELPLVQALALPAPSPRTRHVFACTCCSQLFVCVTGGCDARGDGWGPLHGN